MHHIPDPPERMSRPVKPRRYPLRAPKAELSREMRHELLRRGVTPDFLDYTTL